MVVLTIHLDKKKKNDLIPHSSTGVAEAYLVNQMCFRTPTFLLGDLGLVTVLTELPQLHLPHKNSNVENLPPHVIRLVYKDISALTSDPPEGIKVFPNEEDITDVQVTIEGPEGTPYSGGLFRMKLILGKDFPGSPPKGYFLTKIFHPNVGSNGEICVNVLKKDWKAELGIRHVLLTIKCLLIHPNPESALNEEAGRLLLENYEEYAARARLLTEIHAQPSAGLRTKDPAEPCSSSAGASGEGPMAKKHAGDRDKKLASKKKTDKKRALRRL